MSLDQYRHIFFVFFVNLLYILKQFAEKRQNIIIRMVQKRGRDLDRNVYRNARNRLLILYLINKVFYLVGAAILLG